MTRLFTVGLSHRTAPVELRESVDFSRGGAGEALAALAGRGISQEMVVLSTCNRAEIYAVAGPEGPDAVARFFAEYHELPLARLSEHLYVRRGDGSRAPSVPGRRRPRLAGRRRAADPRAGEDRLRRRQRSAATPRRSTNRLFHTAFGVGKRVRRETGLSEGAVSVSYAAIALARKIFGDLTGLNVLILGAGGMAKLTGIHLKAQQVRQITIASRTLAAAERLARAARRPGRAVDRARPTRLSTADIVVTATGAVEPVLTRASVAGRDAAAPPAAALHHRHRACRATSSRASATSSRSSSTTSTTSRASSRRT